MPAQSLLLYKFTEKQKSRIDRKKNQNDAHNNGILEWCMNSRFGPPKIVFFSKNRFGFRRKTVET